MVVKEFLKVLVLNIIVISATEQCSSLLFEQCGKCKTEICLQSDSSKIYNCSLPGLDLLQPGIYEGVTVNYLSWLTHLSSPNMLVRAKEFESCTGAKIIFSESQKIWEDPIADLGSKSGKGQEVYDAYFMSYSHFPEASSLGLAENLNEKIRENNDRIRWDDMLPQVRNMGEYRDGKTGITNLDFLMYDGDYFLPAVRIDLLEKFNISLPNTWEELEDFVKFFNGTDLNNDGEPDFGFCSAGYLDWRWSEHIYSIWATYDQTKGMQNSFFFDEDTMEPRINTPSFTKAADLWGWLWENAGNGCTDNMFNIGRCAVTYGPPGCLKRYFLSNDKYPINRKDETGKIIWYPTLANGEYAEPYRFRPFGSLKVLDRATDSFVDCNPDICPYAEKVPPHGHHGEKDRASELLPPSPHAGKYINRAPFYWSGGLGVLIRNSATKIKKDVLWDYFVYTNSPTTSQYDVANYVSFLDSWRYSQLVPGENFIEAGWSQTAYNEHASVHLWALGRNSNGAFNLRLPGLIEYTRDSVGGQMDKYINDELSLEQMVLNIEQEWIDITRRRGKLDQLEIYRASLGLEPHSEVDLCRLHRVEMDLKDPSTCTKYDPQKQYIFIIAIVVPIVILLICAVALFKMNKKRVLADSVWSIKVSELSFSDPPEVLGRGTFGLVLLAEYRGTQVAVKRVIPPREVVIDSNKVRKRVSDTVRLSVTRRESNDGGYENGAVRKSDVLTTNFNFDSNGQDDFRLSTIDIEPPFQDGARTSFVRANSSKMNNQHSSSTSSSSVQGDNSGLGTPLSSSNHKKSSNDSYSQLKKDFINEMRILSKLRHPCITTIMGAVIERGNEPMLVMEFMQHGSLFDLLHNETVFLEGETLFPILKDIAQGLRFLHAATPKVVHGDLKGANVLVDSKFRAKVADFGLSQKKKVGATGTPYWMSPELLLRETDNTTSSDVYAFGIVLYEVYSRKLPYEGENYHEVIKQVCDPKINKRPPSPKECPLQIQALMSNCIERDPLARPTSEEIDHRLRRMNATSVQPNTSRIFHRTNKLLNEVFPPKIARALKQGEKIEPEHFDMVTIFFCDIVGFTTLSETLTALKVVSMLDRLYNKFDDLAQQHDVFKIETIGDCYIAVTNLLKDQSNNHAKCIAHFAIDVMKAARTTLIDEDDPSKGSVIIRVGFHSGPAVANVLGYKQPKYSIFGDSVNTASRMESSSIANKIHCSEASALLVKQQAPEIDLVSRGPIPIKGKGMMQTFWINESCSD